MNPSTGIYLIEAVSTIVGLLIGWCLTYIYFKKKEKIYPKEPIEEIKKEVKGDKCEICHEDFCKGHSEKEFNEYENKETLKGGKVKMSEEEKEEKPQELESDEEEEAEESDKE